MMRILFGYDGSESADAALYDLKRAGLPEEAEALVVSVADVLMVPETTNPEIIEHTLMSRRVAAGIMLARKQAARSLLEARAFTTKASERMRSYFPGWHLRTQVLAGQPSQELIRIADEWKPDLVVVGSRGRSLAGRFLLGSVSKAIVTGSDHSVRVTRGTLDKNGLDPIRLVIGIDGSSEAEHAVRSVGSRVWPSDTEVRIISVDNSSLVRVAPVFPIGGTAVNNNPEELPLATRRMVAWAENELTAIGLNVSVAVEKGDPRQVLITEAKKWNADAIFVGGRKFSGALERLWLGSVATALVTNAHCTVEVVRNPVTWHGKGE
ncbi:MAG TPA: universal stress protein [Pyrinomonadaceae bacterium]|nr:universal stress protein [Pyrinomonadaceae bacterium]